MNILVRAPNWIGDQILAYPFFYYLRRAYPRAHIASVCVPWVSDLQFRNMVNEIFVLDRPLKDGIAEKMRVLESGARELRARSWDLAFSLPNSFSAAWLLYRAGAKVRRGYRVDGRGILLNDGLRWDAASTRHRAQAYLDLLPSPESGESPRHPATEFWGVPPENDLDPGTPGELESFNADLEWPVSVTGRLEPPREPYWVLAPGSTAESRRWPLEYFAELAERIGRETGWLGIIVGGAAEAKLAARLSGGAEMRLRDWTAMSSVAGLASVFRNAKFTLTNESGLAHVAALSGSFVQIVCGAADPRRTRPIGPGRVQVSVNPVDCWPCERNVCLQPAGLKLQCLAGIKPERVWEEVQSGTRS